MSFSFHMMSSCLCAQLESAIQRRKHRAIIRSAGLRAMEVALKSVSFPSVKREILRSLIPSLQFSEDLSLDATPRVVNHLEVCLPLHLLS